MTLIEATFILLALATLSAILAPQIGTYVNDAKMVKVKEEVELLGVTTTRLMYDLGNPCLKKDARKPPCSEPNRVNILYGRGPDIEHNQVCQLDFVYYEFDRAKLWDTCSKDNGISPENPQGYSSAFVDCVRANKAKLCIRKTMNWDNDDIDHGDSMDNQFVRNIPGYSTPSQMPFRTILGSGMGWRGSYLGNSVDKDPWGNKYLINSQFLSVPPNVDTYGFCSMELQSVRSNDRRTGSSYYVSGMDWSYDTFVISAGPNGIYETPFALRGAEAKGDDIIYVIQGDPR